MKEVSQTDKLKVPRPRGTGSLYQREGSEVWYLKYYINGKAFRESTKLTDRRKAENKLKNRLLEIAGGNFGGPKVERIKVEELAADFLRDYRINNKKSLGHAEARWTKHLKPFFGHFRAVQVTSDLINKYVDHRQQEEGASNATVNRELACLKRMFHLGQQSTPPKVNRIPHFPHLAEDNVRTGFLQDEQYSRLAAECSKAGLWMKALFECAYAYGWRKSELLNLRVNQVDLASRTVRLNPGETKNKSGRTVVMTDAVYTLLTPFILGKQSDDFVFTRDDGKPVKNFRTTWRNVCEAAGVPGLHIHDLRRTGARNLRRLGVDSTVIMKIGGWKTDSVFRRYNITDEADLADAAARLNAKRERLEKASQTVHTSGHTDQEVPKKQCNPSSQVASAGAA